MNVLSNLKIHPLINYIVSIVIGIIVSYIIIIFAGYCIGFLSSSIRNKKNRMFTFVSITAIVNYFLVGPSLLYIIFILYSIIMLNLAIRTEKITDKKIKSGKYNFKGFSYADTYLRWGSSILTGIIVPIFIKIPELICKNHDIRKINWLKFYWSYDNDIWSVLLLRMTIICLIVMLPACSIITVITSEELEEISENNKVESKISLKKNLISLIPVNRKIISLDKNDYNPEGKK